MKEYRKLLITARHLLDNISAELYESSGECLWELVRNGVCACMPGNEWIPGRGEVEATLVESHPLASGGKALVVLDRGSGFTEPDLKRFCAIGPSLSDKGTHQGAAQKRIGRFSAFSQNRLCFENRDTSTGFYILTRTAQSGPVRFISMIPEEIEREQAIPMEALDPTSRELGPLQGIKGSFSAFVIPNPVFSSHEEIRQALQWLIPRKPDQMFKLIIGSKRLKPPPLAAKATGVQQNGQIEFYLERSEDDGGKNGGIWLTDAVTGLRAAFAPRLSNHLPYPLWHRGLTGDIFVPGLYANQDTARASLTLKYLKSQEWRKTTAYLVSQVVEKAKALLGQEEISGKDAPTKALQELVDICNRIYGQPDTSKGPVIDWPGPGSNPGGGGGRKPGGGSEPKDPREKPKDGGEKKSRPRVVPIRIGEETFYLSPRTMDPRVLAQVDSSNGQVLYFNQRGYEVMPPTKDGRVEHVILKVLEAVGQYHHPGDPFEVQLFVAERRKEMLSSRK